MHPQKKANIYKLPEEERYDYFIRRVSDFEEVWLLQNSKKEVQTILVDGKKTFPVWPEKDFIDIEKSAELKKCKPFKVDVYDFQYFLKESKFKIAVFPLPDLTSIIKTPFVLLRDIEEECKQYE